MTVPNPKPPPCRIPLEKALSSCEDDLALAARTSVPVLVTCCDGGLREQCARLIHARSERATRPFVLAQEPADLRRSFERAVGGTLFLDDIVFLTDDAQEHLLAVLGVKAPASRDPGLSTGRPVRLIAGASRSLHVERAAGIFNDVLFYRLNIVHVDISRHRPAMD